MPLQPHDPLASTPAIRRPPVHRRARLLVRAGFGGLLVGAIVVLVSTVPGTSAGAASTGTDLPAVAITAGLPARVDSVLGGAVPRSDARRGSTPVELGLRFSARVDGVIAGLRVYRPEGQTPAQLATLWTAGGTRLAEVTVRASTAAGWVYAAMRTPVRVQAEEVYVASYYATDGYVSQVDYFSTGARPHGLVRPALIGNTVDPRNGVFRYGASSSFPTQTVDSTNYWVDVAFVGLGVGPAPTSTTSPTTPTPPCPQDQQDQQNQPFCTVPPTSSTPTGSSTSSGPPRTCPPDTTTCPPDQPPTTTPTVPPTQTSEPTPTSPTPTDISGTPTSTITCLVECPPCPDTCIPQPPPTVTPTPTETPTPSETPTP